MLLHALFASAASDEGSCEAKKPVLITDFPVGSGTGWSNFGSHLYSYLLRDNSPFRPLMAIPFDQGLCNAACRAKYSSISNQTLLDEIDAGKHTKSRPMPYTMLHAVSGDFLYAPGERIWAEKNAAVVFRERARFRTEEQLANAAGYDTILAGSEWNTKWLKAQNLQNVHTILQGVDTEFFKPGPVPRPDRLETLDLKDKFVIFSGGKLESRKGQDIIIRAFSMFAQHIEEAVLVTAWHNPWEVYVNTIENFALVDGAPKLDATGELQLYPWLKPYGIEKSNSYHLGKSDQARILKFMQAADVAVFTNRAEGGTNLVAMEAMAAGLPVVISNNTGHEDILKAPGQEPHCFPLPRRVPGAGTGPGQPYEDWGDSSAEDLMRAFHWIYEHPELAKATGAKAREFIKKFYTWERAIKGIVDTLAEEEKEKEGK